MHSVLKEKLAWTEPDVDLDRLDRVSARLAEADGPADDGLQWPGELWRCLRKPARPTGRCSRNSEEPAAPGLFWCSATRNWRAGVSRRFSSFPSMMPVSDGSRRRPKTTWRLAG